MADTAPAPKTPRKKSATAQTASAAKTSSTKSTVETTVDRVKQQAANLAGEASEAAKKAATSGKDKAVDALGGVSRFADEAAKSIDEHLGEKYGDYARKASAGISKTADTLSTKNVEDLVEDAKEVVRKNPLAAIGVAAAVGFLLTRLARSGGNNDNA